MTVLSMARSMTPYPIALCESQSKENTREHVVELSVNR